MNKRSKFQEVVSIWMIFIVLTCFSGCYSYRSISTSDLCRKSFNKYLYLVHGQDSIYVIDKVSVLDGTLSGKINNSENYDQGKSKIHIYPSSDSVIKINSENILVIPIDDVAKVLAGKNSTSALMSLLIGGTLTLWIFILITSRTPTPMYWSF